LFEAVRVGIHAVVVWRYDGFTRSLKQLVNALDHFRALGIEFVSIHDGCDTTTAQGRLVFGIMASLAEFERELAGSGSAARNAAWTPRRSANSAPSGVPGARSRGS
jgi:DNA invertase Pin-like site-specific DNA recombinase